ncbi:MAG: NAD(P)H-binding protein [Acidimicrobiales bacterium]|nr:NAD(P)H-binding protein [Acidimicrobiales bacterium]
MAEVIVTGGSGFTGSRLILKLISEGHRVVGIARSEPSKAKISGLGAEVRMGDLEDFSSICSIFKEFPDAYLANIASMGFGSGPNVVNAASESGIKRSLFVSTTSIFTTLSTSSKPIRLEAEDAVKSSDLDWTIIRPTMIYGAPGDRNMERLLRYINRSKVALLPLPGHGQALQQPVNVYDLIEGISEALFSSKAIKGEYNLGGPEPMTLKDTFEIASLAVGNKAHFISLPISPLVKGAQYMSKVFGKSPISTEQILRLDENKNVSIADASRDLNYQPRSFKEGITDEWNLINHTMLDR